MYVQYSNLYLLVVTRENVNAASMLLFLHKLKEVFVHYFNELEEESLRDNFVIAYELLDEVRTSSCMNRYHISWPPSPCHLSRISACAMAHLAGDHVATNDFLRQVTICLCDRNMCSKSVLAQYPPTVQVMDYGFPQFTEAKILSEYIKTDAYKMEVPFLLLSQCSLNECLAEHEMCCSEGPLRS